MISDFKLFGINQLSTVGQLPKMIILFKLNHYDWKQWAIRPVLSEATDSSIIKHQHVSQRGSCKNGIKKITKLLGKQRKEKHQFYPTKINIFHAKRGFQEMTAEGILGNDCGYPPVYSQLQASGQFLTCYSDRCRTGCQHGFGL